MAKKSTIDWTLGDLLISEKVPEKEIAYRLNCNVKTVQNRMRKLGVYKPKKVKEYDWSVGNAMLQNGASLRQVARKLGCANSTVMFHRKWLGLSNPKNNGRALDIDWNEAERMIRADIDHGEIAKKFNCCKDIISYRARRIRNGETGIDSYPYYQELKKRLELVRVIVGLNEDMFNQAVKYPNCWRKIFIPKLNQSKEGRKIIIDLFGDWNERKTVA